MSRTDDESRFACRKLGSTVFCKELTRLTAFASQEPDLLGPLRRPPPQHLAHRFASQSRLTLEPGLGRLHGQGDRAGRQACGCERGREEGEGGGRAGLGCVGGEACCQDGQGTLAESRRRFEHLAESTTLLMPLVCDCSTEEAPHPHFRSAFRSMQVVCSLADSRPPRSTPHRSPLAAVSSATRTSARRTNGCSRNTVVSCVSPFLSESH